MFKKNYFIIISFVAVIVYISILYGYFTTKNSIAILPTEDKVSPAIQQTELPSDIHEKISYKIVLMGNTIFLLKNDVVETSRDIIPSLLPSSDIELLTSGISYDSYEKALMDWESLSN